jgi:hypothetical protein
MRNILGTWEHAAVISFGPSKCTIVDLNKPYIMQNGGELSNLENLHTTTVCGEYLKEVQLLLRVHGRASLS